MAVFTWIAEGSTTGTFDVVTRSSSFVASYQIDTRSGSYPIENQVVLRSGEVTLYQSSGYRTSPITASDIVLEQGILSYIIDSPFKNNFYNTALYKNVVKLSFSGSSLFSGFTGDILVTFNPADDTCLYNISGSVGQKFIKPAGGNGLITFDTSISASEIFAPVNTGSTTYVFYGEGSIASGDTTAFQSNTRVAFIPLNTILIFNTNAFTAIAMQYAGKSPTTPFGGLEIIFEELEANAPPQQFKYSNSSTVKHNKLFTWVATASDITITGTAVERNTEKYVVSGLLSTGFSAEAKVTFNPPDSTQLFNVSGSATTIAAQLPKIYEGSGSLFSDGFFSNLKVRFNPLEDTALFNITGEHGTKVFVPNWRSSGTIPISGTAAPSFVRNHISSGSITTSASGTAKVIFTPVTDTQLFDTSGTALIKFRQLFRDSGSGTIQLDGSATDIKQTYRRGGSGSISLTGTITPPIFVPNWISTGTATFSGDGSRRIQYNFTGTSPSAYINPYQIVFGQDENYEKVFYTSGNAVDKFRQLFRDSGSGTIEIDGSATDIKQTYRTSGSGTISLTGTITTPIFVPNWISTGSISITSGILSRKVIFTPVTDIQLFDTSGTALIKFRPLSIHSGSGTIEIDGSATDIKQRYRTSGSGSISLTGTITPPIFVPNWRSTGSISTGASGSAKVAYKPVTDTQLFSLSGTVAVIYDPLFIHFGSGTIEIDGSATDIKQTYRTSGSGSISLTGTITPPIFVPNWRSSGTIPISGTVAPSFVRNHISSGSITTSASGTAKVRFNPLEDTALFDITGEHGTKVFVPNWRSSGLVTTSASGTASVTFNPPEGNQLFDITGQHGTRVFVPNWISSGSITTSASGTASVTFNPPEDITLFDINGFADASKQTIISVSGEGTIEIGGELEIVFIRGGYYYETSGTLFIIDGGSTRVTFNPPEGNQLFDVSGSFSDIKITSDYEASGSASLGGTLGSRIFVPNWIGSGTIAITGESTQKHIDITSGSGTLFSASGASQSVGANPPENTSLFAVSGSYSNLKFISANVVSGSATFSGTVVEKHIDAATGSGTATLSGSATEKQTDITSGSGSLFSSASGSAKVTFNPPEGNQLFDITGQHGTRVFVPNWISTGTVSTGASGTAKVAYKPVTDIQLFDTSGTALIKFRQLFRDSGSGTIQIDGSSDFKQTQKTIVSGSISVTGTLAPTIFVPNWRTTGSISTGASGTAKVAYKPVTDIQLFDTSGTAVVKFRQLFRDSGSGTIQIDGSATDIKQTYRRGGSGSISVTGTSVENHTDITSGSGSIITGSYHVIAQKIITPDSPEINTSSFVYVGISNSGTGTGDTGGFNIGRHLKFGTTQTHPTNTERRFDLVALDAVTFTSLSVDVIKGTDTNGGEDPEVGEELQLLYSIDQGNTFTPINANSGIIVPHFTAVAHDFSSLNTVTIQLPEEAKTSSTIFRFRQATASNNVSDHYGITEIRSNSITPLKIVSASFRPFDATDTDALFTVLGSYSSVKFISQAGESPILFDASGNAVIRPPNRHIGSGTATLSGSATEKQTDIAPPGSGSLFSSASGFAKVTFNPPEDTQLFDITGQHGTRVFVPNWISSGSLFTAFGGTASITFKIPDSIQLFDVSGSATEKQTDITSGSGSLFSSASGSAKVTFNPPEGNQLFDITGQHGTRVFVPNWISTGTVSINGTAVEKQTDITSGSGTTTFSGTSVEKQTDITSGSGSLFAASGASQSVGANPPEDTALFSVSGTYSNLKYTSAWDGTGTLFTVSGAAERVTFNPPEDTQLFVVTGAVSQAQRNVALPGSGSLFTAFGGTASVTFNPPEDTQLFDVSGAYSDLKFISANTVSGSATFSGTLVEKFASANVVSGTAEFSGTAVESQTDITSGSGSLFAASGAAEAFGANPPEDTALFDINGTYSDLKSTSAYVGSGSLFTFSGAVVVATISEIGTGLFDIGDTAIESTTYKTIDGTGSLFGFAGGVESVTFNPVENTQLFQVSGEVYVTTTNSKVVSVLIEFTGDTTFRRVLVPEPGSGEILSSGESINNKIFSPYIGSGSFFAASGSAETTTNASPIDPIIWEDDNRTTLYLASGSASVSRAVIIDNNITININGVGRIRTAFPEKIFVTII